MRGKIKFFPIFLFYSIIILWMSTDRLIGDEPRYLMYANNLMQGYYSPRPNIDLHNGPGYPLVLVPFIFFKSPLIFIRLLNAVFLGGAVLYFFHTLRLYSQQKSVFFCSYIFGLYPPFFKEIGFLLSEKLSLFLIGGFIYHFCKSYQTKRGYWINLLISSFFCGYLALTRVIFGYVILFNLAVSLFLYQFKKTDKIKKTIFVYSFSLLVCLPYLTYTYFLTGKIFYWSSNGGQNIYCMASPYKDDLGDWFEPERLDKDLRWAKNHKAFFDKISKLSILQQDEALKRKAFQNIINYPEKFILNWTANVGRLLFNYPYSYTPQKLSTYAYILPNMFLVIMLVFSVYPAYVGRRQIPFEIFALLGFVLIAFGGSSIVFGFYRYFQPLVPFLFLWIFLIGKNLRLEIISDNNL